MAPTIAIITTSSASAPIATSTSNPKHIPGFEGNNEYSILYLILIIFKRKFHIETHILLYDKVNQYYTYFTINIILDLLCLTNQETCSLFCIEAHTYNKYYSVIGN
jgi:hypothetical protein